MQANIVTRNEIDWGDLESQVDEIAKNATSIQQTMPAITKALELINTNHSFIASASGTFLVDLEPLFSTDNCDNS